jgi:hypothetical protein
VELITRSGNNWTDFMREAARKVTPEALAARLEFQRAAFPAQRQLLDRLLARPPFEHLLRRLDAEYVGSARRRHLVKGLASPAAQG